MRARLNRLLAGTGLLLALGLGYAAFVTATGWAIPCLFRRVTGLLCPGCGMTGMCLALLRLDLAAAWAASPGVMLLLPLLGVLCLRLAVRYVRTGSAAPARWENALFWAMAAWLIVWDIWRNIV